MVRCTSRKVAPHELHHIVTLLHASESEWLLRALCLDLFPGQFPISVQVATPNDENIAKLDVGSLVFRYLTKRIGANGAGLKSSVLFSILETPCMVVEQNASTNDALFCPSTNTICIGL